MFSSNHYANAIKGIFVTSVFYAPKSSAIFSCYKADLRTQGIRLFIELSHLSSPWCSPRVLTSEGIILLLGSVQTRNSRFMGTHHPQTATILTLCPLDMFFIYKDDSLWVIPKQMCSQGLSSFYLGTTFWVIRLQSLKSRDPTTAQRASCSAPILTLPFTDNAHLLNGQEILQTDWETAYLIES